MPSRLADLIITKVSICKRGSNPGSHQVMWKANLPATTACPSCDMRVQKGKETCPFCSGAMDTTAKSFTEKDAPVEPAELRVWYGKKDYSTDQRVAMAKKGQAIPVHNAKGEVTDGRYPIGDTADLSNASQAFGRGSPTDKTDIAKHIVKNAKRLGALDQVGDAIKEAAGLTVKKHEKPRTKSRVGRLRQMYGELGSLLEEVDGRKEDPVADDSKVKKEDLPTDLPEAVQKFLEQQEKEISTLTEKLGKQEPPAPTDTPEERKVAAIRKAIDDTEDEGLRAVLKSSLEMAETAAKDAKEAREEAAKLRVEKSDGEWTAKLTDVLKHVPNADPAVLGPIFRKMASGTALEQSEAEKLEQVMAGASEALRQSQLFEQIGRGVGIGADSAYGKLEALAKARLETVGKSETDKGKPYPFEKAFAEVCADPANSELVELYRQERDEAQRR